MLQWSAFAETKKQPYIMRTVHFYIDMYLMFVCFLQTPVKAAAKPKKVKEVVEKVKPEEKKEAPEEKTAPAENGETKDEEARLVGLV